VDYPFQEMGTNGSEIARKVADELGYLFFETEAIIVCATNGDPGKAFGKQMKRCRPFFTGCSL